MCIFAKYAKYAVIAWSL